MSTWRDYDQDRCSKCRYYDIGECRRHSPVTLLGENGRRGCWPPVSEGDWCGDFELKPERR